MKYKKLSLTNDVVTSYDKTKTTILGRVTQKTIDSVPVLGPPLTKFIDVSTDSGGLVPGGPIYFSSNDRLFLLTAVATGSASLMLYNFSAATGAYSYVGRILLVFPNSATTTHTLRSLRVYDGASVGATTGWKVFIMTSGSIAENGGLFMANNIALSDFAILSPPSIPFAIANNTKAMYQLQDPVAMGIATPFLTPMGMALDRSAQVLYASTGTAASMSMMGFDVAQAPNVVSLTVTPPANGSSTWTCTNHGLAANDLVVLTSNVPTPFVASTTTTHTPYWVHSGNLTANTFELKTTKAGGASTASTQTLGGTGTAVRAWGASNSMFLNSKKTGVIATGFAGTALLTDAQHLATISDVNSPNNGQHCYIFPTSTAFYTFRVSDIATSVTSLPTASGVNIAGNGTDIVAPTATFAQYSESTGMIVYTVAQFSFVLKRLINSQIAATFGGQVNTWLENTGAVANYFRASGLLGMECRDGWLMVTSSTVGQRGIIALDLRSDDRFDFSKVISPVVDLGAAGRLKFVSTIEQLFDITDTLAIYYRTASTSSDPVFNSDSGGWTQIDTAEDLSASALQRYVQVKLGFNVATLLSSVPTQVNDVVLGYQPESEISERWLGSVDNTSPNGASPAYSAFRLIRTYSSSVPTLFFRAYDDNGVLVASANTSANPSFFEYSTNNGGSWNALGTVPNTAGTTEVRYKWTTPPGVRVSVSLRED